MNRRAQALIFASITIALLIILLAISSPSLRIREISNDEELKTYMLYYFYSQAIAYGTQKSFERYETLMNEDPTISKLAAWYAEVESNHYLNESLNRSSSVWKGINRNMLEGLIIKITSNGVRGINSSFKIEIFKNNNTLMKISFVIKNIESTSINESVQIYYKIIILYNISIYLKNTFIINNTALKVTVISNKENVDFIRYIDNDKIILILNYNYKDILLIKIKDERGITGWLLA